MTFRRSLWNLAATLVVLIHLASCGDTSSPDSVDREIPPTPGEGDINTTSDGTVFLERRGDKLTAEAWFVTAPSTTPSSAAHDVNEPVEHCSHEALALEGIDGSSLPSNPLTLTDGHDSTPVPTGSPATRLIASSRGQEYFTLIPQSLGQTTVYATEANWIREAVPDDLSLAVYGAEDALLFDPIALRPVDDPVMLTAASGRLESLASAVRWSVSPGEADTRIRLRMHAWAAGTTTPAMETESDTDEIGGASLGRGRAMTISCLLDDDGEFVVPPALLAEIGEASDHWTVRLARERRTHVYRDGSRLEVVQSVQPLS